MVKHNLTDPIINIPDRYGGAIVSPEDSNDTIFERLAEGPIGFFLNEMPLEFDLRRYAQPSRDQGRRGTCAAFAGSSIREIQAHKSDQFEEWMSPEFIYYHRDNKPLNGMHGRNVFQIMQRIGSVPETEYPYDNKDAPSPELYRLAAKFKIANFAKITTCDGLKKALLEIGPCYLQLPLYSNRPYFWRPLVNNEKPNGGHAVTVVGYTVLGFILKNSWGTTWNDSGCIVLPYDEFGCNLECWVGIDYVTSARITPRSMEISETNRKSLLLTSSDKSIGVSHDTQIERSVSFDIRLHKSDDDSTDKSVKVVKKVVKKPKQNILSCIIF